MSDPGANNPYGPPHDQQGGSYPQYPGQPQQPGQPGQPYGGYPGGPPVPAEMSGTLKAAQVLLFVFGGLGILGGLLVAGVGALLGNPDVQDAIEDQGGLPEGTSAGLLIALGLFSLIVSIASIVVGTKFGNGGSGIRIAAIVCGGLLVLGGLFYLPLGMLWMIGGVLVVVFTAKKDASAWFGRPRY